MRSFPPRRSDNSSVVVLVALTVPTDNLSHDPQAPSFVIRLNYLLDSLEHALLFWMVAVSHLVGFFWHNFFISLLLDK